MGMMKNYMLKLLQQCSEEQFGQDAIEWAIASGLVHLSYHLEPDVRSIMLRYDEIIEAYRRSLARANLELRKAAEPMKRANPRRKAEASSSVSSIKRKNAA
jgi:hypothetical protein